MLLHLSDLHFGTEKKACMDAIERFCQQHDIEAIAVSGDLTQRARFKQFAACKQFLDRLNVPYLVVPGNHDIPLYHLWNRAFKPLNHYRHFFGDAEQTLETEHFYLMGLNSIRRHHHTKGHISHRQIQDIDHALKYSPSHKLKLVVVHQPFYTPFTQIDGARDCPKRAQHALEQWSKHDLFGLLHGHLHQTGVYDIGQIFGLNTARPIWDIHAGTAISWRLRHGLPNGFNTVSSTGEITHYCFDVLRQEFVIDLKKIKSIKV